MPKPYSKDLRHRMLEAYQTKMGEGSMRQLVKRFSKTGNIEPKPHAGGRSPAINAEGDFF